LKNSSIASHLQRITLLSLIRALALFSIIVIISNSAINLNRMIVASQVEARMLAENAAPSLLFSDLQSAQSLLDTLQLSPQVDNAAIYNKNNELFVSYNTIAGVAALTVFESNNYLLSLTHININQPIVHQQKTIGHLLLQVGLYELYQLALIQILITVITLLFSLFYGKRLLVRLSESILTPLSELTTFTSNVSKKNDYTVRVKPSDIDELNILSDGLNTMLHKIQNRDERLMEYGEQLEDKISERTAQLEKAKDLAETASKAKSEFLANISHELRTPMNGILGASDLLESSHLDSEHKQYVSMIHRSGTALLSLLNNLLDFSKIEAGKMELEVRTYNIENMIQHLHDLFDLRSKEKGINFATKLSKKVGAYLRGDELRVQQILINLLGNAIKFTEEGEITLSIHLTKDDKFLRFEVKDTGIGIPVDKMASLFKSFTQMESSTTRKYGGSGLGLAISKQLVNLMQGNISVKSKQGQGSCFWFEIPYCKADNKPIKQKIPMEELDISKSSSCKILMAEDNKVNQMVALGLLKKMGFSNVDVVDNGNKAVRQLVNKDYDLVLMDIQMPECNGLDACRQIRGVFEDVDLNMMVRNPEIPVIALTANAMASDIEECMKAGMNSHVAKPIDKQILKTEIIRLLGDNY